jgi:MFS family permease
MLAWLHARFTGLWRKPDFLKLWTGQTISQFGTLITGLALPLAAIGLLRATPAQVALLSAAGVAPRLLLGLFAGVWVDRLRRRPLLIVADLGRALVLGSVPVAALLGLLRIGQFYGVAAASSTLGALFDVAYPAYLPSLLHSEELAEGNSKLAASEAIAEVAGFGMAGLLIQALTAPLAVAADALSYLVSAGSLLLIRAREPAVRSRLSADAAQELSMWSEIGAGLRHTLRDPVARALVSAAGIFTLGGHIIEVVLLLYLVRTVHLSSALLGILFGIGGLSALPGALLAERVARRWGLGRALWWGLQIYTASALVLPLASGPTWLVACLLALGQWCDAAHTVYAVSQATLLQGRTPPGVLGRLYATLRTIEGACTLVGLALGGLLGQVIGLRATLFVAAGIVLLAPLCIALSPVRTVRSVTRPEEIPTVPAAFTV